MPDDTQTSDPSDGSDDDGFSNDGTARSPGVDEFGDDSSRSAESGDESTSAESGDESTSAESGDESTSDESGDESTSGDPTGDRFEALAGVDADRVDEFLDGRVAFTAREWALARLCADYRTKTGVEMKRIGENLPDLVPYLDDTYTRKAVYSARRSFEDKVREAGATFLYGAYGGFFTAEEVDELTYEATEVAKFLLEVEGTTLAAEEEVAAEQRLVRAMRAVHEASLELRYDRCPHCGEELGEASS